MGLASKEKLWQVSLLLVEHLKRTGLVPGKFVYDEICSVSFAVLVWLLLFDFDAQRVFRLISFFVVFVCICFCLIDPSIVTHPTRINLRVERGIETRLRAMGGGVHSLGRTH